ncbi:C40 family peptidase [Loigolactobacillus coryniformis]|jgi:cell wall-associated NlpC family hydrolase|uniref:C40 family peptidase n=1 Tax=Loigolactobacillus coryniformis TaxID=1610 RepID=UPI0003127E97|nr:C40 family peptidase [Loigolactobacillus coryniformis]MBW4802906.1 C40 family peptidase [Loigolactobacillus coryniformis subsp. torquens]MBW4805602.1 C40 family peptidase [Loigolactobacillus coryniformis subsp. torquens]MCL5458328.1 NlpC/P60 family protein [Loigolactobacillus coryniformis]MDT3391681.1 NlpC/P60 family protein [Bacillota bacterium]
MSKAKSKSKNHLSTYLAAGVAGLAGATLAGAQQAQAAQTAEVTYQDGATTVWNNPTTGQKPTRYLTKGQAVKVQATKQVFGEKWYQIGTDEWVPAKYFQANTAEKTTAKTSDTVTGNYKDGAITIWTSPTSGQPTGNYMVYGQTKTASEQVKVGNITWYKIADNAWVPSAYVAYNNTDLTGVEPAKSADLQIGSTAASTSTVSASSVASTTDAQSAATASANAASEAAASTAAAQSAATASANAASEAAANSIAAASAAAASTAAEQAAQQTAAQSAATASANAASEAAAQSAATASANAASAAAASQATSQANAESAAQSAATASANAASEAAASTAAQSAATASANAASEAAAQSAATASANAASEAAAQSAATASANAASAAAASQATSQATQVSTNTDQASTQNTSSQASQATNTNSSTSNSNSSTSYGAGAQAAISAAESQIGVAYVWGGESEGSGFDCSGLTQWALAKAGVSIGRVTTAQESAGSRVSISQLQPGDLVFWGSAGATYHVALYIGNNQYINAPQPGETVTIASISSYFMPSFGVHINY